MKKYAGIKTLADKLAEKKGITKKEAEERVKDMTELIKEIFVSPEFDGIQFVDFLTLERVERAARIGRNPRTKEAIQIPAKKDIRAKVGNSFEEELNK